MELLPHQIPYAGPPPRFAPGATVYYHSQPYTVERVVGRAPGGVGWVYELDGPAELIRVGEGEVSNSQLGDQIKQMFADASYIRRAAALYGVWSDPALQSAAQQRANEERALHEVAALSGQPVAVCRAALADYLYGMDYLIDQLKRGAVNITPDGDVVSTNYRPYDDRLTFSTQVVRVEPRPQPRLNRAARRAKHRPWSPPTPHSK